MKTKVEIEGYKIEIEFEGGVISVKAEYDDETIEEFTIEVEQGSQNQSEDDEIQAFDEFGQDEEEDFEGEEEFEDEEFEDEEFEDEEMEDEAPALESFQSFINKRSKRRK
jgi:hypothetical protein